MFLDSGKKLECTENNHACTGRTCKLHTRIPAGIRTKAFPLWDERTAAFSKLQNIQDFYCFHLNREQFCKCVYSNHNKLIRRYCYLHEGFTYSGANGHCCSFSHGAILLSVFQTANHSVSSSNSPDDNLRRTKFTCKIWLPTINRELCCGQVVLLVC